MTKALVFDLETLDNKPTAVILDIAAVIVDLNDPPLSFEGLLQGAKTFYVKLNATNQKGRTISNDTLQWWSKQSKEAQAALKPTAKDVDLSDGLTMFYTWLQTSGFDFKNDLAYCRGASFDFAVVSDACHRLFDTWGMGYSMFPCAFWNQRDIRTALAHSLAYPALRKMPVAKGVFDNFVKHNSQHDVCKDAYLLTTALSVSLGQTELPTENFDLI